MTPAQPDQITALKAALRRHATRLEGPILVLGASGFVGANLFATILEARTDVHGTASRRPAWRLEQFPWERVHTADILIESNLDSLLEQVKPKTVFNCIAFGAYSFEQDAQLIYQTNFTLLTRLLPKLARAGVTRYIHAGSSSEYGTNSAAPHEDAALRPNSDYAVSKSAAAQFISYYGRNLAFPCANLRLYSVYGPLEDSSRLIPCLIRRAAVGELPEFVSPETSRDFIYVLDAVNAFLMAALELRPEHYGSSLNIGTGRCTTMRQIADVASRVFGLTCQPVFSMPGRSWDTTNWFADPTNTSNIIHWQPLIPLEVGLQLTADWFKTLPDPDIWLRSSKKFLLDERSSVSAIIACYRDNLAIPIMYQRLKDTFARLGIDHEIIFVNDCSPDDSEEVIRKLSADDPRVVGISHSRNFGSQAAFMSGLRLASKNSCVLLDGDLQDPPEIIEQFVTQWRAGADVVYGRRVKREAPLLMQIAYKAFYRVFDFFSYIPVPHDAGDFSLLDRKVVNALIRFPERDLFLRGVRAFAGFRQIGVDYVRPERMFGRSTNNLIRNMGWAKKGILSFSNTPLQVVTVCGVLLFLITIALATGQTLLRLFRPELVPEGITTVLLLIMFFGSVSILCTAIIGEYVAKIFEEVKQRPLYIRRSFVRNGEIRSTVSEK
jgi:nucleoside-diphosphate-sugar epimerase/glycosyltransferase involved in cell wall biosynthesis